eukprot:CAMPEP_0203894616 /NCGR_PEP_ID=MMETSP0359-20131031/37559_1 /ASSEMBLY_ACC=CAM_ASM_000338 /TAXON_ID=268821 /ORGANISM="Scrippsiella Hangoei, Strain SHTV-5" /LENGTH=412 /DNA_ID=CAMNT_0050816949 /DNA_START=216 /DNA_END=1451 /DNA_ORIENTATION=+
MVIEWIGDSPSVGGQAAASSTDGPRRATQDLENKRKNKLKEELFEKLQAHDMPRDQGDQDASNSNDSADDSPAEAKTEVVRCASAASGLSKDDLTQKLLLKFRECILREKTKSIPIVELRNKMKNGQNTNATGPWGEVVNLLRQLKNKKLKLSFFVEKPHLFRCQGAKSQMLISWIGDSPSGDGQTACSSTDVPRRAAEDGDDEELVALRRVHSDGDPRALSEEAQLRCQQRKADRADVLARAFAKQFPSAATPSAKSDRTSAEAPVLLSESADPSSEQVEPPLFFYTSKYLKKVGQGGAGALGTWPPSRDDLDNLTAAFDRCIADRGFLTSDFVRAEIDSACNARWCTHWQLLHDPRVGDLLNGVTRMLFAIDATVQVAFATQLVVTFHDLETTLLRNKDFSGMTSLRKSA